MSDPSNRFFLQALDPHYGCSVLEAMFVVADLTDLQAILGPSADSDPQLRCGYPLDASDLARVCERFCVTFDPGEREVELRRWHSIQSAPYLVHTNYELFLLLDGTKKFACFLEVYPPLCHFQEDLFDRYVAQGLLHKEVFAEAFPTPVKGSNGGVYEGEREVCYALRGETWRIPAWRMIRLASEKSGWNDDFERLLGMLFGYEEWQMDWWMSHRRDLHDWSVAS